MTEHSPQSTGSSSQKPGSVIGKQVRNLLIVLVAVALSVAMFLGISTQTNSGTLAAMAKNATPLETAVANDKPTLMEFYADWCASCQAIAPELGEIKQQYGDRVNFVMLNVDNSKWLPEILHYGVNGIPHFVFLDRTSQPVTSAIGEPPRAILEANLDALIANAPLPFSGMHGQSSSFEAPLAPGKTGSDDPRSHSSQVVE